MEPRSLAENSTVVKWVWSVWNSPLAWKVPQTLLLLLILLLLLLHIWRQMTVIHTKSHPCFFFLRLISWDYQQWEKNQCNYLLKQSHLQKLSTPLHLVNDFEFFFIIYPLREIRRVYWWNAYRGTGSSFGEERKVGVGEKRACIQKLDGFNFLFGNARQVKEKRGEEVK